MQDIFLSIVPIFLLIVLSPLSPFKARELTRAMP